MIALIILGVFICVLAILLLLPLTVDLVYEREFILKIKYLGITLFDNKKTAEPKKSKQAKKTSQDKESSPKKENFIKRTYKQKGLLGTIDYFSKVFTMVLKRFWWVAKRFKFRKFNFDLVVATSDAADTAIQYGEVCAVLYPVLSLLQSLIDFKPKQVNISADFDKTKWEFKTSILVKTRALYWIIAAVGLMVQFLKLQRKEREKYERKQHKDRNGHNNGKTTDNG